MAAINKEVDFTDELTKDRDEHKAKHKRAGIAHKLAVVLLFDQHHQNTKPKGKSVPAGKRGALESGE